MSFVWILVFGGLTLCGRCSWCDKGIVASEFSSIKPNENLTVSNTPAATNLSDPVISVKDTTKLYPERYARFFNFKPQVANSRSIEDNEVDDDDKGNIQTDDPTAPLYGIYSDCLFKLSFQCVQRKLLVFLDRLSRMKSISVISDMLTVVRTKQKMGPVIDETDLQARLNPSEASSALSTLLEYNLERFLQSHVLRISLPSGVTASVGGNSRSSANLSGDTVDINISRALEETTGRGKDKKMKKLMGMLMTGLMGKMAFMGPFMVLIIKLKAMKALILSKIALMLSLFHLFKGGGKKGGATHGKEVIIVHDSHAGHENLASSAWATGGGGGWSGNGAAQWLGNSQDSYSQGTHTAGADATYAGTDQTYSTGTHAGGWGNTANVAAHGWGRRSSTDPHWVTYRAYIPEADERK